MRCDASTRVHMVDAAGVRGQSSLKDSRHCQRPPFAGTVPGDVVSRGTAFGVACDSEDHRLLMPLCSYRPDLTTSFSASRGPHLARKRLKNDDKQ